jgi:hypothetical protein
MKVIGLGHPSSTKGENPGGAWSLAQVVATAIAELTSWRIGPPARRASCLQLYPAFVAELCTLYVIELALRALHLMPSTEACCSEIVLNCRRPA